MTIEQAEIILADFVNQCNEGTMRCEDLTDEMYEASEIVNADGAA